MAIWAERGVPDPDAFIRILELLDPEDDKKWLDRNPNNLQKARGGRVVWGGRPAEATRHLLGAEEAIHGRRNNTNG